MRRRLRWRSWVPPCLVGCLVLSSLAPAPLSGLGLVGPETIMLSILAVVPEPTTSASVASLILGGIFALNARKRLQNRWAALPWHWARRPLGSEARECAMAVCVQ